SGSVDIATVDTSADIGESARVTCAPTTCANTGAASAQEVRVSAGNQFHELGIAASLAIGGSAGVGVGAAVRFVNLNTDAYMKPSAKVNAGETGTATASGRDQNDSIAAAAGRGTVRRRRPVAARSRTTHRDADPG